MKEILLEVTDACNLHCTYCNKWKGKSFLSPENFEIFLQNIYRIWADEIGYICFWGGEPLLNPDLFNNFNLLKGSFVEKNKVHIAINSNGTLLLKKMNDVVKFCQNLSGNIITLYISLDGITQEENSFRGLSQGKINEILLAIKQLQSLKIKNLQIKISGVLGAKVVERSLFENSLSYFIQQNLNPSFCLQETMEDTILNFSSNIARSLVERYLILEHYNVPLVIESNKSLNNLYRIDVYGNIYNLIDRSFMNEKFLVGTLYDGFLKELSVQDEGEIWKTIYKNPHYIILIKKLFRRQADQYEHKR